MTKTAWRYEIKYGPEGEANYAWVYDSDGEMVCTAKTHHAEAIVSRMNTTATLQGEDAVERVKVLARRFWSIHPSTIAAMNLTREEFYAREMMALLATGLVPDEAAIRADEREKAIHDADQFVGALWSDLFNKDMVKAEGAYLFDKWRVQIRAAAIRSGGAK